MEQRRNRRVVKVAVIGAVTCAWMWSRVLAGRPPWPMPPVVGPLAILVAILGVALSTSMRGAGRSPHVLFRPSEIETSLDDVKGLPVVVAQVVKILSSTPRTVLFEGPPGCGKTYVAKAMAKEAGVPLLYVSAPAFPSMHDTQTSRKVRTYFTALHRAAREEGGAIGFIGEIDAIGGARAALSRQLQTLHLPPIRAQLRDWAIEWANSLLPSTGQIRPRPTAPAKILVIGATSRAADLDPALQSGGSFDRSVAFDFPTRSGRREIIDYYLDQKAHEAELDDPGMRDTLAAMTSGYSPVMIEHVLDEALARARRRGAERLSWMDVQRTKMGEEIDALSVASGPQ